MGSLGKTFSGISITALYRKKRERERDTYSKTKQLYRHLKNGKQVTDLKGKRKTVHCTELITIQNVDLTLKKSDPLLKV